MFHQIIGTQNTEHTRAAAYLESSHISVQPLALKVPGKGARLHTGKTDLEKNPITASITLFRTSSFDAFWEGMPSHNMIADKTRLECGPYVE